MTQHSIRAHSTHDLLYDCARFVVVRQGEILYRAPGRGRSKTKRLPLGPQTVIRCVNNGSKRNQFELLQLGGDSKKRVWRAKTERGAALLH